MQKERLWHDMEMQCHLPYGELAKWLAYLLLEEDSFFEQSEGHTVNLICGYRRYKRNDIYAMPYAERRRLVCRDLQSKTVPRGCIILWIKIAEEMRHGQIQFARLREPAFRH